MGTALWLVVTASSWQHPAHASAAGEAPAGEALFQEGRRLLKAGDLAGACAKFEESLHLDPAVGTLANLADCEERLGRTASAWQHWRWASEQMPATDKRKAPAIAHAAALEKTIPRLTLHPDGELPSGTTVERDGAALGPASLGEALPLDPGAHVVIVRAPERQPHHYDLTIVAGEQRELLITAGPPVVAVTPELNAMGPGGTTALGVQATAAPSERSSRLRKVAGFGLLGVGAVAAVGGTLAGLQALNDRKEARNNCGPGPSPVCWTNASGPLNHDQNHSRLADIGFATATVAVAAGAYLLLTGHPRESTGQSLGDLNLAAAPLPTGAAVQVAGSF